jgi:hypothetical protein
VFKLSPEIAAIFGAFGEGVLLALPWLLDQNTMDLLSQAGYDPNEDGKIYTGIRAFIFTITIIVIMFFTVGMIHPVIEFVISIACAVGVWMLPNYFLSKMHRR